MSEEEKKAIETVEGFIKYYKTNEQTGNRANLDVLREECQAIEFILNKYDVTQKELNNIKEIEKSHKEENGKLREEIIRLDNVLKAKKQEIAYLKIQIPSDRIFYFSDKDYISKDKIKEKLELLKDILKAKEKDGNIYKQIPIEYLKGAIEQLENLLEDK